jgi:hypothetical protein
VFLAPISENYHDVENRHCLVAGGLADVTPPIMPLPAIHENHHKVQDDAVYQPAEWTSRDEV